MTKPGNYAFAGCSSLTSLTLVKWELLLAIGEGCFMDCTGLQLGGFGEAPSLGEIQASAFCGCNGYSGSPTINSTSGISVIGDSAFKNTSWNTLTFNDCADTVLIGPNAFRDSNLQYLFLAASKQVTLSNEISDAKWNKSDAGIFYNMKNAGGVNLRS
jgi:hypothetical protein